MGIAYLVQGLNLFSPGSAVRNVRHCKVLDPSPQSAVTIPPLYQRLQQSLNPFKGIEFHRSFYLKDDMFLRITLPTVLPEAYRHYHRHGRLHPATDLELE